VKKWAQKVLTGKKEKRRQAAQKGEGPDGNPGLLIRFSVRVEAA
jgi:hypothetical protein